MSQQQTSLRSIENISDQLTQQKVKDILEHYGVPGMKWGRRRARSSGDGKGDRPPAKNYTSSDFKKTQPLRGRKPHQLTNKQLKTLNERMSLERKYRDLNPTTINKGKTTLREVAAIAGTTAALIGVGSKILKSPAGQRLIKKGSTTLKVANPRSFT